MRVRLTACAERWSSFGPIETGHRHMIDRIELKKMVDIETQGAEIIDRNKLERCQRGDRLYWQSNEWGRFSGCCVKLEESGLLSVKVSLHKVWQQKQDGHLDNSRRMRLADVPDAVRVLQGLVGVDLSDAVVHYFEIGCNLRMERDPSEYIAEVVTVDAEKGRKVLYMDANFEEQRQKTSIKSKDMRKVLKIYDKSHEAADRGRDDVEPGVLRVETIYKRQKIPLKELVENLRAYAIRFEKDWLACQFKADLEADPGCRVSQIEKARDIMRADSIEDYLERERQNYLLRRITKKQWETVRVFARAWPHEKHHYRWVASAYDVEYKKKLKAELKAIF